MAALFELRGVRVVRSDRVVLDGLDLSLPDGGVTALFGPSGCGKSTVLRLCNRLLVPERGTVLFRGEDVATVDPMRLRRRVGMVFQRPTPFPGTVIDNLRTAADLDTADAARLVEQVALDPDLLHRDASELSGGEQQRVCLARTLATGPEALLVDEGTSALDAGATAVLEELIRRVAGAGCPVVWVTHDGAQVERLADHRVAMPSRASAVDPDDG